MEDEGTQSDSNAIQQPELTLPKGGGAIRGIGEKFSSNPVTGTGSLSIPIAVSPGRSGFSPQLFVSYDSNSGNGLFGLGWQLGLPSITRKTEKGLPRYDDATESDTFVLSGAEDLVSVLVENSNGTWEREELPLRTLHGETYQVVRYRPRLEGLFSRIERWVNIDDATDSFWRSISRDNITTWYGKTKASRIFAPGNPAQVFSWLISESHDDKGNVIVYDYKAEDSTGINRFLANERNRTEQERAVNRYIKSIKYGNREPYLPDYTAAEEETPLPSDWLFEVVFDYGEHNASTPLPTDSGAWYVRNDPYSTYRSGFEVRTYRLCQRVLMFHHFTDEENIAENCLVRSTDFNYQHQQVPADTNNQLHSVLKSVTQIGYRRDTVGGYHKKTIPPVEFEYSQAVLGDEIVSLDETSQENLPHGVDGANYRWLDLEGEGITGVVTEQGGSWFYKNNESPITRTVENGKENYHAKLGAVQVVNPIPSAGASAFRNSQFLDLAGDGMADVVSLQQPVAGFYQRTTEQDWQRFRAFEAQPNIDWNDPNLRFVDLTGDGRADILINERDVFTWYGNLTESGAEAGFAKATQVAIASDEDLAPHVMFSDPTQSVALVDLCGDGLSDIVRIRNGEVCYWPNLGYGRFGKQVVMDNAPWFDHTDLFDPQRLRLADIDGSGLMDIIYLGRDYTSVWFNQSGNAWSEVQTLNNFPRVDDLASVNVVDLLGNGTACLVWSSPTPGDGHASMRYLQLMAEGKPHLLVSTCNNMGAETRVQYTPSTYFYLKDKAEGKPWITRLPFPVHVVERVETYEHVSGNHFVSRYAYHHGCYDGSEREFRGFGMVEQWDTEDYASLRENGTVTASNVDEASHIPPLLTRTWFHTGAYLDRQRLSNLFATEYYREPDLSDDEADALLLEDTLLAEGLSEEETREACRSLKGAMLRQEVYALDGTDKEPHPYTVSEQNFTIRKVQGKGRNRYAVFFTHPREALSYQYERNPADPRTAHSLTLEVDDVGNVLKSAAVVYGRREADADLDFDDQQQQTQLHITCNENEYTNTIDFDNAYRTPLGAEGRSYELTGLSLNVNAVRFTFAEILDAMEQATELAYTTETSSGQIEKRIIEHTRTLYRPDDLGTSRGDVMALLPLGEMESLALGGEAYQLAFTSELLNRVYAGRVTDSMLADEGGYVQLDNSNDWWIPSGRMFYSFDPNATPQSEVDAARQHYFTARRYQDPFGNISQVTPDQYDLSTIEIRDAIGNVVNAVNDYRVLQPCLLTDPNGNQSEVAFDTLGQVVGTAVMGKPGEQFGDHLNGFEVDLEEQIMLAHFDDPFADPHSLIQGASSRLVYDLFAYMRTQSDPQPQSAVVYTLARETHSADLQVNETSRLQHSFAYSDGFGRVVQNKIQAEPGPVPQRDSEDNILVDANGQPTLSETASSPRWIGNGWTVFNNKGKPVRQFEPFFTDTHRFEADVRLGVSPILFYDPAQRVVATLNPNHSWEKVVFDPWRQQSWDVNDTVLIENPGDDIDVGNYFRRLADEAYLPTWYSQRRSGALGVHEQTAANDTAIHAATPSIVHLDSLGRSFLTVVHNKLKRSDALPEEAAEENFQTTRIEFDIEGNQRKVIDALDRIVMQYDYDMLGNSVYSISMEAGERWMLNDIAGQPIRAWDSRGHEFRTEYDVLRRPIGKYVGGNDASQSDPRVLNREVMFEKTEYGEGQTDDIALNLRTRAWKVFDSAGMVVSEVYDFKGNLLQGYRQLASDYKNVPDWSDTVALEAETYTSSIRYDAFNRPITATSPDGSILRPAYNEANLLESIVVNLRGAQSNGQPVWTPFVNNIDYNAKGQRTRIEYANDVASEYRYDQITFRLINLLTHRNTTAYPDDCPDNPSIDWPGCAIQNLSYIYDPVGNITHIQDEAQQTIFFNNQRVEASNDYRYDATYQLIEASGREHLGQNAPTAPDAFNAYHINQVQPGDGNAMGTYIENYVYDAVGNFLQMQHRGSDPANPGWTRDYRYEHTSIIENNKVSNRLTSTKIGNGPQELYTYDAHGSMTTMPHLPLMHWTFLDQLRASSKQVVNNGDPETTYYVYDATGQRVRKVTERQANDGDAPTRKNERIYLDGFELYREYDVDGNTIELERETLHIMDDQQRIAMLESRTQGDDGSPSQLIRYQLNNHLGSSNVELDNTGQIIFHEEYFPYGSTSYQAMDASIKAAVKRYRYTGMERDEETGLNYHAARYYVTWLGKWCSVDPIGILDGSNLFSYVGNNPLIWVDRKGTFKNQPICTPEEPFGVTEEIQLTKLPDSTESVAANTDQVSENWFTEPGFSYFPHYESAWMNPVIYNDTGSSIGNFVVNGFGYGTYNLFTLGVNLIAHTAATPVIVADGFDRMTGSQPGATDFALLMAGFEIPYFLTTPLRISQRSGGNMRTGVSSPFPRDFVNVERHNLQPSRSARKLALGRSGDEMRLGYIEFAEAKRLSTYDQLSPRRAPRLFQRWTILDRVNYAMREADIIYFNLAHFTEPTESMRVSDWFGRPIRGYTRYEYSSLIEIEELRVKSFFVYYDGDETGRELIRGIIRPVFGPVNDFARQ